MRDFNILSVSNEATVVTGLDVAVNLDVEAGLKPDFKGASHHSRYHSPANAASKGILGIGHVGQIQSLEILRFRILDPVTLIAANGLVRAVK